MRSRPGGEDTEGTYKLGMYMSYRRRRLTLPNRDFNLAYLKVPNKLQSSFGTRCVVYTVSTKVTVLGYYNDCNFDL